MMMSKWYMAMALEDDHLTLDVCSYMGGQSRVDILVATPGRLTDHIRETPNFTLQHLRFLVIDEADQLLNHSYNDWLNHILNATRPQSDHSTNPLSFKKDKHG